jgi:hypothetical protein
MRSPSRDAVIDSRIHSAKKSNSSVNLRVPVSHGRGGAGNISNSRSRSRSRDPAAISNKGVTPLHSSGRGGYGNFKTDESSTTLGRLAEEEDRKGIDERHECERQEG